MTCDFTFADENSLFSTPGVDIGLFCSTPAVALARCGCNPRLVKEMLFTGRRVQAKEALQNGLISRICGDPEAEAKEFAQNIASKSSSAIKLGKRVYYQQVTQNDLKKAYETATKGMIDNCSTLDANEGISAFIQKRPPVWID